MSEPTPLHRLYSHYSELPYSLRVLYTMVLCILGSGYLFALTYLIHTNSGRDGNPANLTYEDIVITYAGSGKGSKLESALRGPMSSMLPGDEAKILINWVQGGADKPTYESQVKATLDKRCMTCHDGSNPHLPNFSSYDNLKKVAEQDTGTDIFTLVRVSHIHLFGITFIFFLVGVIFSHAYVRPVWLKCVIIAMPLVCLFIDVISWYLVKVWHPFAWVTMGAGGLMGLAFAFMWVSSSYQMWFQRTPPAVRERQLGDKRGSVG
jgi:hypothetical protein